jgi:hypothetical protein
MIIVTVAHVRAEKLCTRGMREWLAHHGIEIGDFVKNGIPIETLEATGDALALRVCARARMEAEK